MPKLMKCKSCGNMIAKSASVCPQCGGKVQRTSGCTILFLIVFILITFSVFLQAVVNKDSNSASSSPENIQEETKEQSENTIPKEAETQLVQPTEQEPVPVKEEEDKLAQSVEQKPVPVKEEEENKEEMVLLCGAAAVWSGSSLGRRAGPAPCGGGNRRRYVCGIERRACRASVGNRRSGAGSAVGRRVEGCPDRSHAPPAVEYRAEGRQLGASGRRSQARQGNRCRP